MKKSIRFSRRRLLGLGSALAATLAMPRSMAVTADTPIRKAIASSGEKIPVIGMGTSRTFDAMGDDELLAQLQQVTRTFFDMGGGMIDSSPMYGSSQRVIGQCLPAISGKQNLFAATKVWIEGKQEGIDQMQQSLREWGIKRFDLMQIHNLVDWETHLDTLKQMKADGKIRYIGITTSHGRSHQSLRDILQKHDFDFVQLSYNIADREVESSLLPIAQDRGVAVIANRPFQRGELFKQVRGRPLPAWAQDVDCSSWGQYFLKFVVSHPAITCAIPATSKVKHMTDNMQAGRGRLPTASQREQMLKYFSSL